MMRSLYNHILLAVMAFAAVGCLSEVNTDIPSAESGDEVQFGLSLPSMTRTVYGDKNAAGTAYPIYWVDGDKVQVYSPQCLAGRNDAEYKVSVTSRTQNYATSLTPTGVNGVQWGNEPAMFYSVYPSGKYTISEDGATISGLRINFSDDFEVSDDGVVTPKGADCLMFAQTAGKVIPGEVVNLSYSPIATSVIITLQGPSDDSVVNEHTIQSIKLIAPENVYIAGKFNVERKEFNVDGDRVVERYVHTGWSTEDGAKTANTISVQIYDKASGAFHKIKEDESLSIPLFLAPLEGLEINENWKVEVVVNSVVKQVDVNKNEITVNKTTTFTKSLAFKNGFDGTLKPGMVHELPVLPALDILETPQEDWDVTEWMENIPRNVYLSEVSIPGTWNSMNPDCQSVVSISDQYKLGVRAFHLDTRWTTTQSKNILGILAQGDLDKSKIYLSVADGNGGFHIRKQNWNLTSESYGQMMNPNNTSFEERLKEVVRNISKEEYMIVFCTFAQESYNNESVIGKSWIQAISEACENVNNDSELKNKIFDGSTLTSKTLVGDVLNKVIVVVNLEAPVTSYSLPANSKCLFTYVPMLLPSDHHTGDKATIEGHVDPLYYSTKAASGISMYTTHAQISTTQNSAVNCGDRGYSHPLTNRDKLVEAIWDWSKSNYNSTDYNHDHWMYLGLGGYIKNSSGDKGDGTYDDVENRYATMIYNRIEQMGKNKVPFYPLGIVLMNNKQGGKYTENNQPTSYGFSDICKKVLMLNNQYRMQYNPDVPADWNPNAKSASDYGATVNNGGNVILMD